MANTKVGENLTPGEIQRYLDDKIAENRHIRDNAADSTEETRAVHFIDAYQEVRKAILGSYKEVGYED